ncbi:hypothetical protein GCM10009118_08110 [Wandonia haliotis]|uniref:Omp28-related outer membrane protein n=1 Tax=Wandonia haliotis TaxID=574963 RepID=A0ABP3Y1A9_9FLAO
MKKICFFILALPLVSGLSSCDKVENAYHPAIATDLDPSYYPGEWSDYEANEWPEFTPNSNTLRNVLIEDYTGHTCNNCPNAATTAHNLEAANPTRVFSVGIHAGPGGMTAFQNFTPGASKYYTDHTNAEGLAYGLTFQNGFNFFGNPQGTVNRAIYENKMFDLQSSWSTRTSEILNDADLKFNIQSVFNYYSSTNGGYLHIEVEKLTQESIETNLVVYVVKNEETDWQKMPDNSDNPDYLHENKHLGSIDGQEWGRPLKTAELGAGEKVLENYSYGLPEGIAFDNLHFLIYVYDVNTYEILQVVKQEITE